MRGLNVERCSRTSCWQIVRFWTSRCVRVLEMRRWRRAQAVAEGGRLGGRVAWSSRSRTPKIDHAAARAHLRRGEHRRCRSRRWRRFPFSCVTAKTLRVRRAQRGAPARRVLSLRCASPSIVRGGEHAPSSSASATRRRGSRASVRRDGVVRRQGECSSRPCGAPSRRRRRGRRRRRVPAGRPPRSSWSGPSRLVGRRAARSLPSGAAAAPSPRAVARSARAPAPAEPPRAPRAVRGERPLTRSASRPRPMAHAHRRASRTATAAPRTLATPPRPPPPRTSSTPRRHAAVLRRASESKPKLAAGPKTPTVSSKGGAIQSSICRRRPLRSRRWSTRPVLGAVLAPRRNIVCGRRRRRYARIRTPPRRETLARRRAPSERRRTAHPPSRRGYPRDAILLVAAAEVRGDVMYAEGRGAPATASPRTIRWSRASVLHRALMQVLHLAGVPRPRCRPTPPPSTRAEIREASKGTGCRG